MVDFIQFFLNGILVGLIYALLALSFIVIYRGGRILNLAQGEVMAVGGFVVWTFVSSASISLWVALPLSFLTVLCLGLLVERGLFRRMISKPTFSNIMITIGLMLLMHGLMLMIWGAQSRLFPAIFPLEAVRVGPFIFTRSLFIGGIITLFVFSLIYWFFEKTKWGLRLTTVAEGHKVAQSMGISVKRSISIAWALGFVLSALVAVFLLSGRSINFGIAEIGLRALPVALLAGLESIWGTLLAGLIIGVGEALAGAYLDQFTLGAMSESFPFLIMLIILLIKPQGLFGWKIIERI